jgi:hypothetical protein
MVARVIANYCVFLVVVRMQVAVTRNIVSSSDNNRFLSCELLDLDFNFAQKTGE